MNDKSITIVVPNYNGKLLLEKNFPFLMKHAKGIKIIVVDDGSQDGSVNFLKTYYPQVEILILGSNHGFSYACNAGVRQATSDIVYLLNSDVAVTPGFIDSVLPYFQQNDVFAVGSFESDPGADTVSEFSIPLVKFKLGIFWYWYEKLDAAPSSGLEVFCVSGGHTAFDRKKFIELGGFDELFRPFYAEDGDICWRAWKRGWRSLCEPHSIVTHLCKGTIGRLYAPFDIRTIHWKNRFLLTWKDITCLRYLAQHLLFLIPELLLLPLIGKAEFTTGFLKAIRQLPELLQSRKSAAVYEPVYTDVDLFRRFSDRHYLTSARSSV